MSIHFDFIVDDEDAENIFFAMRDYALKGDEAIMDYLGMTDIPKDRRDAAIKSINDHKAYLLNLIKLMKNTKV